VADAVAVAVALARFGDAETGFLFSPKFPLAFDW